MQTKFMDHAEYPESLKTKSFEELYFIAKDARATLKANPNGDNAGYYQDEINYVCNEINRRRNET